MEHKYVIVVYLEVHTGNAKKKHTHTKTTDDFGALAEIRTGNFQTLHPKCHL